MRKQQDHKKPEVAAIAYQGPASITTLLRYPELQRIPMRFGKVIC